MENLDKPLISVFTCVYNMADKVHRCLDAIKNQTYQNIEHIIVNDGSTDNIDEVVEQYIKSVPYTVKYIKKHNGGLYSAINKAWDNATGDFIIQLDADDKLLPDALEFFINTWKKIPKDVYDQYWCVHGRCVDQKGVFVGDKYPDNINSLSWEKSRNIVKAISGEKCGMMKTAVVTNYRYPEPIGVKRILQSVVWIQINKLYRTWYTNQIVRIYYRFEGGSASSPSRSEQGLTNRCWDAWWKLNYGVKGFKHFWKEVLRYSVLRHCASKLYKKNNPFLKDLKKSTAAACVLVHPVTFLPAKIMKLKWKNAK